MHRKGLPMMTIDWTHAWLGDVPALIDRGGADAERIGAAGVSMGACIVYGAIARERRLRAAVALLGSPARGRPDGSRLAVDRFFPSALLSVTAGADVVVPPAAAASLHAELTDWYRNDPDRLCHQSFPDAEHLMKETDWQQAIDSACAWLLRFLAPTGGRLE